MGQLTHTMRPAFGSNFKCSVFHICPPCATTFLFFCSRRISGMTFNQPRREVRRMAPPRQRFIEGNTVRSFTFSLVVNKHTGLGPPLKGRTGVWGAHSSSNARVGSLSGDGQRRWGEEPAWGQLHVFSVHEMPSRICGRGALPPTPCTAHGPCSAPINPSAQLDPWQPAEALSCSTKAS